MKSVFYILTISKVRYIACVEMGDTVIATTCASGFFHIRNSRVIRRFDNIGEAIRGQAKNS
jgi:hypothetical protein